ncbi:LysR family transcriptional regulator [uncultured Jatrophihabitans sp.]|uniref:LysR family transcriptional regulator n=1 Tax=uncultured Jatrophihabitans sp. TaxID=1610747 RepID=UPI0035CA5DE0
MSGLELRHLQVLVALTEEGSFTDAAIRLRITQSAVSRTVTALEAVVGERLVERTTRSVALTPAGVRTYRAAVQALAAVDDVLDAARGRVRPLRVGYSWSALGRHTTVVLRRWRAERPDVALEVHRVDERDGGLARGAADVAVVRGEVAAGEGLRVQARTVFAERRMAVLPDGHRLARAASVRLDDLVGDTVLVTSYGTTTLDLWPPERRPASTLRVDNTDEWLTEIAGGLAIGVTAESTAVQHPHPGVVFVPLADGGEIDVHLVWPSGRAHPAVADFVALVERVVAGDQRLDAAVALVDDP